MYLIGNKRVLQGVVFNREEQQILNMEDKYVAAVVGIVAALTLGLVYMFLSYRSGEQSPQTPTMQYIPIQANNENMPIEGVSDAPERAVKTEETRPRRPHITNHVLTDANRWYEIPIPPEIRTWSMNARGEYDILYSFEPSQSTFRTLFSGTYLDSDTEPRRITPTAIYISSATAGAVVEMAFFR